MGFLDASILVRHLCGEPPEQAARAHALIASGIPLWISEPALLETAYVLESTLGKTRQEVVDALIALVREPNIRVRGIQTATVLRALLYSRPSRRVSYGDALIWAVAHEDGGEVYTFDRRFPGEGVTVREP